MIEIWMMIFGLLGGMMRLLIGYSKIYSIIGFRLPFDYKRALLTIAVSLMAGALTPILIKSENPSVALIAGFAGIDLMEALAKGLMKLKTGYTTGFGKAGYSEFGTSKYSRADNELTDDQESAIAYIQKNGQITASDYERINRTSPASAYQNLKKLVRLGLIAKHRKKNRIYYTLK